MEERSLQIAFDPPRFEEVIVPSGVIEEGILSALVSFLIKELGNPLWMQARFSFHIGNGIFEFREGGPAEYWLLYIDMDGYHVLQIPEELVFRIAGFKSPSQQ